MPKYKVVKPIEHNQTLYLPETAAGPASVKSVSHGMEIPVDASGTIDLDETQATNFRHGQIAPHAEPSATGVEPKRHGRTQR
jgi:hypothetical protein